MVEPQIVVLAVAGSSPVGHPIFSNHTQFDFPPRFLRGLAAVVFHAFMRRDFTPGLCCRMIAKS